MKKKMFFIGALKEGGAERVISLLTNEMVRTGEVVEIVTYYDREIFYDIHKDVSIVCVEKETQGKGLFGKLRWIRRYFKENAQVVISFLAPFNMLALGAVAFSKVPIIVADRNDPHKVPSKFIIRKMRDFLYRFADGVVVQTRKNKEYFSRTVQKKSVVIYNPIDLKEKTGLALTQEKQKSIVSVGRLMEQKNQKNLISAFADIRERYPEYTLTIYGDGPLKDALTEQASALGIADFVRFPGSVDDLHDRIVSAELFVLTSDYEGMPNALIEAMCLGLPVISTKVSGATDLIRDGENGLLVECDDVQDLANAMEKMLSDDTLRSNCAKTAVGLSDMLKLNMICAQWIEFIDRRGK